MATQNSCDYSPVQYDVQIGGANGTLANVTAGTTGQVLTGVTGGAPTFQSPAASSITITGNSGGGLVGNSFTFTGGTTGLTFAGAGSTETLGGTLAIANGGTDATSFTQSNGIVTYNGTRLVNYAGPQLSTGGVMTNTTQPAFFAHVSTTYSNVTGDGTSYQIVFQTDDYDNGSNYSNSTGLFTAPVNGIYHFTFQVLFQNVIAAMQPGVQLIASGRTYTFGNYGTSLVGNFPVAISVDVKMNANDTAACYGVVGNGTKVVNIYGSAVDYRSYFSGFLVC